MRAERKTGAPRDAEGVRALAYSRATQRGALRSEAT